MVGNLSKYFVGKPGSRSSRRSHSAVDGRETLTANTDLGRAASVGGVASAYGMEIGVEFKPVVHPIEPLGNDRPIQCPLLEPSIIDDGIIWKARVSGGLSIREDLAVMQEGNVAEAEGPKMRARSRPPLATRMISPSITAPEHIVKLLE